MTICRRYTLSVLCVVICLLSILGVLRIKSEIDAVDESFNTKIITTSELAALGFSDPLWNYHSEGFNTLGSALFKDNEIGLVILTTENDGQLYKNQQEGLAYQSDHLIMIRQEIWRNNKLLGNLTLGFTKYYREAALRQEIINTLSSSVVIVFVLWLLISVVSHMVTKPIYRLREGTGEIAKGNLTKRIIIEHDDEIGELGQQFNVMAENLENMLGELEIKNHSLEKEINERQQAQVALTASQEKFSKAFQYASDVVGIVELDSPQRYVELSDAYFHVFGYSPMETLGHSSAEINLWDVPEQRVAAYEQLHSDGRFCNLEVTWRTKSGEGRVGVCSAEVITIGNKPHIVFVWHDITERKQAEIALRRANDELEQKVEIRTQELTATNQELGASNEELQNTLDLVTKMQNQLVESEKMAALGSLVAGVAHEISTPVGVGITAISHLQDVIQQLNQIYESGSLRRQDLLGFLRDLNEIAIMIHSNLDRAASLTRSFKQVSVDQSGEVQRVFALDNYLKQIILHLNSKLKQTKHRVTIHCPEELELDSFPGAFAQIITNLVMNSLIHAYEPEDAGHIRIEVVQEAGNITITYSDDGNGMASDVLGKIYDPFFTTKRGKGATGLGMHIVYNIVTQQLHGTVDCQSQPGSGTSFFIRFPG